MNRLDNNINQQQSALPTACKLAFFKAASLMVTHPIDRFTINNLSAAVKFGSLEYIQDIYKGISFSLCHSLTKFLGVRTPAMNFCQQYELSAVSSAVIVASCDILTGVTPLQRAKTYHVTSDHRSITSNLKDMLAQQNNFSALKTIYKGSMLKLFADTLSWTMFFYADKLLKEKFKNKSTASYITYYFFVLAAAEFILCPIKNTLIEMQSKKNTPLISNSPYQQPKQGLWRSFVITSNTKHNIDNLYRTHGLKIFWRRYPSHLALATIRVGLTSVTMSALGQYHREQNKKSGELTR